MELTTTQTTTPATPGFAVAIKDHTPLGLAMLIAESEDGQYEPVAVVANVGEARELAHNDMASRMRRVENDESPLCPCAYSVWAPGIDGGYRLAIEIDA